MTMKNIIILRRDFYYYRERCADVKRARRASVWLDMDKPENHREQADGCARNLPMGAPGERG